MWHLVIFGKYERIFLLVCLFFFLLLWIIYILCHEAMRYAWRFVYYSRLFIFIVIFSTAMRLQTSFISTGKTCGYQSRINHEYREAVRASCKILPWIYNLQRVPISSVIMFMWQDIGRKKHGKECVQMENKKKRYGIAFHPVCSKIKLFKQHRIMPTR